MRKPRTKTNKQTSYKPGLTIASFVQNALGGAFAGFILGFTGYPLLALAVLCGLSGSYTDVMGYIRQLKAGLLDTTPKE